MTQPLLLMCSPDHFKVTYTINPWMQPDEWAAHDDDWHENAAAQWTALKSKFEALGAKIFTVPPQAGWPDMVFTANAGIFLDGRVLVARFRHPERQGEEPFFTDYFRSLTETGLVKEVGFLPQGIIQEGEGDCLWDAKRGLFWAGYGQRSEEKSVPCIADFFGAETVGLELVNPRYYHVDVCMAPLSGGHIMYHPGAFSEKAQAALADKAGKEFLIPVAAGDADRMALNAVNLGADIVLNDCSAELEHRLGEAGYRVHRSPLPAFLLAGGSACCLSMRLDNVTKAATQSPSPRPTA